MMLQKQNPNFLDIPIQITVQIIQYVTEGQRHREKYKKEIQIYVEELCLCCI